MSVRLGSFHGAKHQTRMPSLLNHNMLGVPTQNPEEPKEKKLYQRICESGAFLSDLDQPQFCMAD